MIIGKSKKEIEKMRASGKLVGQVLAHLRTLVEPGISTIEIDQVAEKMIRDAGAIPTFKGYNGFPYSICASVNEQVVHGFPSGYKLKEGDIFSIDCGVTLEGFVGDTATTVPVGTVDENRLKLITVTEQCLELAIEQCRPGNHLGDIGWAVQQHAEANGYSVVRDYVGTRHWPSNARRPADSKLRQTGARTQDQVGICLRRRTNGQQGHSFTKVLSDGWTVVTMDGQPSAHVEHTIAITDDGPEVLTRVLVEQGSTPYSAACN
jgi:methionyl aminopeptidase